MPEEKHIHLVREVPDIDDVEDIKEIKKKYDYVKRLLASVNESCKKMEINMRILSEQNQMLIAEKTQWEQQKALQTDVIQKELSKKDAVIEELQQEIQNLREKLKK